MDASEPRRVEKPWGHEVWWAKTDDYAGKILVVNVGHALQDSEVLEVSIPQLDDVVRLQDRYGR